MSHTFTHSPCVDWHSCEESDTLIICFAGRWTAEGTPGFAFRGLTKDYPVNRCYVRDLNQKWYHGDLPGIGAGVLDLAHGTEEFIKALKVQRVLFMGQSMGGYIAMLVGALLGIGRAIVFSPQTFIDRWRRWIYWDRRSAKLKSGLYRVPSARPELFDLKSAIEGTVPIDVYFGNHRIDRIHAMRLGDLSNVMLHETDCNGHNVARWMKEADVFDEVVHDFLKLEG